MRLRMSEGGKSFFRYIKGDFKESMQAIHDNRTGKTTTYLPRIHELFSEGWKKIYKIHKGKLPNYEKITPNTAAISQARKVHPKGPPRENNCMQ